MTDDNDTAINADLKDMGAWGVVEFALLGSSPIASVWSSHMDHTTSDNLDQADEDILTYTVSDEALEGAAADAHLQAQPLTQWSFVWLTPVVCC